MRRLLAALIAVSAAMACATHGIGIDHARRAHAEAKERAGANPDDKDAQKALARSTSALADALADEGDRAFTVGRLGDASVAWRDAMGLDPHGRGESALRKHKADFVQSGDAAFRAKRWVAAYQAYEAVIAVTRAVDEPRILERNSEAHRRHGADVHAVALELFDKGQEGAALAAELYALHHDPLNAKAFERARQLRLELTARNHISVQAIELDDDGYTGFANAMVRVLQERLREEAPLGPTRARPAMAGRLRVVVEEYGYWDKVDVGIDRRKLGKGELDIVMGPGRPLVEGEGGMTDLVANPEHEARAHLTQEIDTELDRMAELSRKLPMDLPRPPIRVVGTPKPKPTPTAAPKKGKPVIEAPRLSRDAPPRLPPDEDLQSMRDAQERMAQEMARMPVNVERREFREVWILPWSDVTRVLEARVRFELMLTDDEPILVAETKRVSATDRRHRGSKTHATLADPLALPAVRTLENPLATRLAEETDVFGSALARRAERLLAMGRKARDEGERDAALDAFMEALFCLGPAKLPEDAATLLRERTQIDDLKRIVSGPP